MTEKRIEQRAIAEALIDVSCAAHGLDFSAANREIVINSVQALIHAYSTVHAFPLPEDVEPANTFRALP